MKSIFKILFILLLVISCKTENKIVNEDIILFKRSLKVSDTIKLSGFIIFNPKSYVQQFYQEKQMAISDTNNFIRKLKKTNGNYSFIQPYELKKHGGYYDFCEINNEDSEKFINNIKVEGKLVWIYVENENFIVLANDNDKKFITFLCWKPYVGGMGNVQ